MEFFDELYKSNPRTCYICNQQTENIKICKKCGNRKIEKSICGMCSEVQGNFFSKLFLGKRFCYNCIISMTEQNKKENKFSDLIKKQGKIIEKQNRKNKGKKSWIIVNQDGDEILDFSEVRQDSDRNAENKINYYNRPAQNPEPLGYFEPAPIIQENIEEEKEYLKAIELSKKEIKIKSKEDLELEQALKVSMISFEEEKEKRLNLEKEEELALSFFLSEQEKNLKKAEIPDKKPGLPKEPEPIRSSVLVPLREVEIIKSDPSETYDLVKKLATGSMGVIYIGQKLGTEEYFAVKTIKLNSEQERNLIINEVKLTISSQHKNIIKYFQSYEYQKNFWIIEELMSCSLADIILDKPGKIPENIISYILKEVLEGIHYLHLNKRIHRDIKSDNILLSLNGDIKIGDLGFAVQLNSRNANRSTFAGTLLWMPPEILAQSGYNFKIDIWSLGIVAYELALGEPPHYNEGQQMIMNRIISNEAPKLLNSQWSKSFKNFIERCLVKDPSLRADTQELLSHGFIQDCDVTTDMFQRFFTSWVESR